MALPLQGESPIVGPPFTQLTDGVAAGSLNLSESSSFIDYLDALVDTDGNGLPVLREADLPSTLGQPQSSSSGPQTSIGAMGCTDPPSENSFTSANAPSVVDLTLSSEEEKSDGEEQTLATRARSRVNPNLPTGKRWIFTLNNYTDDDEAKFQALECLFLIYGREVGDSGTPHLQGCVSFKTTKRLSSLKKICARSHWERCVDFEAAVNYCMKEDAAPFIKDSRRSKGVRTDLEEAAAIMLESGEAAVAEAYPSQYIRYHGGFRALKRAKLTSRGLDDQAPVVTWLFGDTGTGKTKYVYDECKANGWSLFVAHDTAKWWDGYLQQDAVLIDDMRNSWCRFADLLKILDRYPRDVEVKGGFVPFKSANIFITSQYPPDAVYNSESRSGEDIRQLLRRCTNIVEKRWATTPTDFSTSSTTGEVVTTSHTGATYVPLAPSHPACATGFTMPVVRPRSGSTFGAD